MDKILLLKTQQGKANILASSINGFIGGSKRGTGYVLINGVGTPITDCFDESEREWTEWHTANQLTLGKGDRSFEFKDHEDNPLVIRLSDIRYIRRHGHHSAVFLVDNIIIRSSEDYFDLCARFTAAVK